jgi:hypothetical protein
MMRNVNPFEFPKAHSWSLKELKKYLMALESLKPFAKEKVGGGLP